jgi:hypothetical protein
MIPSGDFSPDDFILLLCEHDEGFTLETFFPAFQASTL